MKLARFLSTSETNYEEIILKNDEEIMKKIIENTEIKKMIKDQPDPRFLRKGVTGDWVNYFNDDQIRKLDDIMVKKLKGTSLEHYWKYE